MRDFHLKHVQLNLWLLSFCDCFSFAKIEIIYKIVKVALGLKSLYGNFCSRFSVSLFFRILNCKLC